MRFVPEPAYRRVSAGRAVALVQYRKVASEESPGSMETRCRVTPGEGDLRESATESKPPVIPCGVFAGKGERVG